MGTPHPSTCRVVEMEADEVVSRVHSFKTSSNVQDICCVPEPGLKALCNYIHVI